MIELLLLGGSEGYEVCTKNDLGLDLDIDLDLLHEKLNLKFFVRGGATE